MNLIKIAQKLLLFGLTHRQIGVIMDMIREFVMVREAKRYGGVYPPRKGAGM